MNQNKTGGNLIARLLLPYIAGIIVAILPLSNNRVCSGIIIIIGIILIASACILMRNKSYRNRWLTGLPVITAFIIIGYFRAGNYYDNSKPDYFGNYISCYKTIAIVDISEPPETKPKTVKAVIEVKYIESKGKLIRTTGRALAYFANGSISEDLRYGDRVMIKAQFNEIASPQNPGEVNYKRYFAFKNLYHQIYIKPEDVSLLSTNHVNYLYYYAYKVRDRFTEILKEIGISGRELAVGASIIMGYRENLDAETIREYSNAGVIHILCVSGLNVAVIYAMFAILLSFLDRIKYGNLIKNIILLLIIWFYAFVCGLCPSILRAAAMFSILLSAKIFSKDADTLKALMISAFILLIIDPFLIADIGFQLSYAAVLGIILLYPHIYNLLPLKNYFSKKAWDLVCVTSSAQIAVSAIIIYYFHFIPVYALFSNLIVVPLAFLITWTGFVILLTNFFSAAGLPGAIFDAFIRFINLAVYQFGKLPLSIIDNISISFSQLILIYISIILIISGVIKRNKLYIKISVTASLLLAITTSYRSINTYNKKQIIAYSVRKAGVIDFIEGKKHHIISDTNISAIPFLKTKDISFSGKINFKSDNLYINKNFIQFYNKRIAIINKNNYKAYLTINSGQLSMINVDYLIISGNINAGIEEIRRKIKAREIIFDSSNSKWRVNNWIDECRKEKAKYYSVPHSGAFISRIKT